MNVQDALNYINTELERNGVIDRELDENRVLYITRHTQLNPRHMFFIMRGLLTAPKSSTFEECIQSCTYLVTREVFGAYRHIYPDAQTISEQFINGNSVIFTGSELEKRYNWFAKRHLEDKYMLYRMFLDMGIMGKITGHGEQYVEASFQYNSFNPISASSKDELCIHPAFSLCFQALVPQEHAPILPRGTIL